MRVADSATWRHGLTVPNDLAKAKIGNLDHADATSTLALHELTLIGLVFIALMIGIFVFIARKNGLVNTRIGCSFKRLISWSATSSLATPKS